MLIPLALYLLLLMKLMMKTKNSFLIILGPTQHYRISSFILDLFFLMVFYFSFAFIFGSYFLEVVVAFNVSFVFFQGKLFPLDVLGLLDLMLMKICISLSIYLFDLNAFQFKTNLSIFSTLVTCHCCSLIFY